MRCDRATALRLTVEDLIFCHLSSRMNDFISLMHTGSSLFSNTWSPKKDQPSRPLASPLICILLLSSCKTLMDPASVPDASACDTLLPPTRFYSPPPPISLPSNPATTLNDKTSFGATAGDRLLVEEAPVLSEIDMTLGATEQDQVLASSASSSSSKEKGKRRADIVSESWIQPPGRKLCRRHQRMADQGTNLLLQRTLDALPMTERETVSNIWASFSSSSHPRRALILQGLLTMCCQSELSLLSDQVSLTNRIDPFTLFPRELALKILCYVDATSLTRAAQVSRLWNNLADDDVLWKSMCEQHIEKMCFKCGWGLPLLRKRAGRSGGNSPTGAGTSSDGPVSNHKRRVDGLAPLEADALHDHDTDAHRPTKRARYDSLMDLDDHAAASTSAVIAARPRPPARIPSSSPFLRHPHYPRHSVTPDPNDPLASSSSSCSSSQGQLALTRPWKDVYSERLMIARNWRLGRATVTALKGHTDGIMCLQFNEKLSHPSFPILITASYDCTVRVWNMETGVEVRKLLGHTMAVRALQFDECKLVTASMDRTLRLWNWRTGQCIRTLEGHSAGVVCLAFDSNVLVSGSVDKTVKVWNFRTGDCFTLRGHMDWVNAVQIWDSLAIDSPTDGAAGPSIDPGKMVFSASDDGTIRLWDLMSRSCVRQFDGHLGQVQSIQLVLVDDAIDEPIPEDDVMSSDGGDVQSHSGASSSHSGGRMPILVSGSLDNTIRVWDVESGKRIKTLFGHIEGVWAVACNNLRLVTGSHDKTIKIWNRDEGKCTATLVGHRGAVTCLAVGDDKIVSGSDDGDVRIWSFGAPSGSLGMYPSYAASP
ncbi:hypothetical protein FRB95_005245 [Tulasnella sp. JGI-2019a]|nr:hypothetical protein FRB95_005245 [Tulasnella sp. JGI-2019a]